jgi:hypothetical protein
MPLSWGDILNEVVKSASLRMHLINDFLLRTMGRSFVCEMILCLNENIKYWGVKDTPWLQHGTP